MGRNSAHGAEADFLSWRETADTRALGRVFDRLAPELLVVAAHVAGRDTAEDLVQTTFLYAIDQSGRWDGRRRLLPWLIGILVKLSLREKARMSREVDPSRVVQPAADDPQAVAETRELAESLAGALGGMPTHYRHVLTLRLVHGLEPAAIAHTLGIPVATVKSRLQRGLHHLRRRLPAGLSLDAHSIVGPTVLLDAAREAVLTHAAAKYAAVTTTKTVATTAGPIGLGSALMVKQVTVVTGLVVAVVLGLVIRSSSEIGRPHLESPTVGATTEGHVVSSHELSPGGETNLSVKYEPSGDRATREAVDATASVSRAFGESSSSTALVRGRVVDEFGEPLNDVYVVLGDKRFAPFETKRAFISRARSGELDALAQGSSCLVTSTTESGSFELEGRSLEHPHLLMAWSDERGCRGVELQGALSESIEIVLPIDPRVYGTIRSAEDGHPIERASVQVWPIGDGNPISYEVTDSAGAYDLQRLPPGSYEIEVDHRDSGQRRVPFTLVASSPERQMNIDLGPLPRFRAQLVDAAGQPWTIDRLEQELSDDRIPAARWAALMTDTSFARRGEMSAEYWRVQEMVLGEDGWVTGSISLPDARILSVWRGTEKLLEANVASLEDTLVVATRIESSATELRIRVVFNPPLAVDQPFVIELGDPSGMGEFKTPIIRRTTTLTDCVLDVPRQFIGNECGIRVSSKGRVAYSGRILIPEGAKSVWQEITLAPPTARIAGVVVDSAGVAIPEARLTVVGLDGRPFLPRELQSSKSGAQGEFELEGLPSREVRVLVDAKEHAGRGFDIDTGSATFLRLALQAAKAVRVRLPSSIAAGQIRVLDSQGRPIRDDRIVGSMSYGGARLRLDREASLVEVYDGETGELASSGAVDASGAVVLETADRQD